MLLPVAVRTTRTASNKKAAPSANIVQMSLNEEAFRFMMNEDAMATEKLAEGIRAFCVDSGKLKQMIAALR